MQDVTKDRDKFIGGSDVPAILGISPFKTRFELLQEKAGLIENTFEGNKYTEYGNVMEGKIREYINKHFTHSFVEDKRENGCMRYHADGYDEARDTVLEIKTTSQIHDSVEDYKAYLAQLLTGMDMFGSEEGLLAVYERPEDFSEEFDEKRLRVYCIAKSTHMNFLNRIRNACTAFWFDLEKVKENPLITEEELQPKEIAVLSERALALEEKLVNLKELEKELKIVKEGLKNAMDFYNIKKWTTQNGTQITLIPDGEPTRKEVFNVEAFEEKHPKLYKQFAEEKEVAGRKGYVKITLPKK